MNALPVSNAESARRRDDVLRELNLYPLWQLRSAQVSTNTPVATNIPVSTNTPATTNTPETAKAIAVESKLRVEQTLVPEIQDAETENLNWSQLKKRVHDCTSCKLRAGCIQTVFGTGDKEADWLFVGSWPSEDDEAKGEPFAGQAGQLLDNMLAAIQLKRGANVYLANIVKCSGSIQRGPQADEKAQCSPYLTRQIQLIQPKIIVALGHAAATALLAEDLEWNSLLGKVHEYRGFIKDGLQAAIPLIITHHPASLMLTPVNKAQTWRDLCLARDTMR